MPDKKKSDGIDGSQDFEVEVEEEGEEENEEEKNKE
jgi:hypothetical protein